MVVWGSGGTGGVSPDPPQGSQQEWASGLAVEGVRTVGCPPLAWGPLLPAISALLANYRQPPSSWMQADGALRAADQVGPHQGGPGASQRPLVGQQITACALLTVQEGSWRCAKPMVRVCSEAPGIGGWEWGRGVPREAGAGVWFCPGGPAGLALRGALDGASSKEHGFWVPRI